MLETISTSTLQPTGKENCGLDKQPRKCKTMTDTINPSMPIATTSNFMGSLISDYSPTFNIIMTLEEGILAYDQEKSKLNIELFVMYYGTGDIWDMTTIEIDEQFICIIAEHLSCKKDDPI